jgi:DNA-binding NtrC family response regulator
MAKLLIVDDEPAQRTIIKNILSKQNHDVKESDNMLSAMRMVEEFHFDVVLTDLRMGKNSGLDLLKNIVKMKIHAEVIIMTAYASVESAVQAMKTGAYNYLTKPIEREELILVVERAAEKHMLLLDDIRHHEDLIKQVYDNFIIKSPGMKKIMETIQKIAPSDTTVLIQGESGTGKEIVARLIHYLSPRGKHPMQSINCSALPETLLESELFGYEKGAFTGATSRKQGIIETAHGSTLFLDEIADMSLNTQAKILRVLQEKEIRRVGGNMAIPVDLRILAATNRNLETHIREGLFREDLFYRLNVIPIHIPPLRMRREAIPPLVQYYLTRRGGTKKIDTAAMNLLKNYSWPGNIRELEAVMERTIILTSENTITAKDLPPEIQNPTIRTNSTFEIPATGIKFKELEYSLLRQALIKSNGVMSEAAKLLGMSYRTFQYRATKYNLLKHK